MNDPWTWTTVWGLNVGAGGQMGEGGQSWDNRNKITIIITIKIIKLMNCLFLEFSI